MDESKNQIKIGAAISYITLFVNIVLSLLYTPWMVNQIGKSNYALYTLASSFISIFLMDFGLSSSVSRYIAKFRAEDDNEERINNFIGTIERLYIAIDIIIIIILEIFYFCIENIYQGLNHDEILIFRSLYLIVALYSVVSFPFLPLSGIINAYEKFIQQKACDMFQKIFSVVLIVLALLINADVRIVVIANAISGIITIFIKIFIIRNHIGVKISINNFDRTIIKQIFSFSIWVTIISLAQRCIFNLAPSILGAISNTNEIALFAPANALEGYFYSFAAAINGLFLARISRHIAKDEEHKITSLAIKVGRYQLILLGSVFMAFIAAGQEFIVLWMGDEFNGAYICAIFMFIPDFLTFSQQIFGTTVLAKNAVREQSLGYIGMSIICVCLSFLLCEKYGAFGSSLAIAISYSFLFFYNNIIYKYKINLNVMEFYKKTYLPFCLPFFIASVVAFLIPNFINVSGWLGVLVSGIVAILFYLILIIPILTRDERNIFSDMISKLKNKI